MSSKLLRLMMMGTTGLLMACPSANDEDSDTEPLEPIDCGWFEEDNCWQQTVAAALECAPEPESFGVFNDALDTCTYDPEGVVVSFAEPVVGDDLWDFTITTGGDSLCLEFQETEWTSRWTTSLGTFEEDRSQSNIVLTCPNGDRHQMNAFDYYDCDLALLPGYAYTREEGEASFYFTEFTDAGKLFSCTSD